MAIPKLERLPGLLKKAEAARRRGNRIVFTNGCFDLIHVGHIRLLERAKRLGNLLIVGLNSDRSVRRIKGLHRPINPEKARAEILAALEAVDIVVLFSEPTPERIIRRIRPHILVKGGDWKREEIVGREFVESYGGEVYLFPMVKGYSTTKLLHSGHEAVRRKSPLRHHRYPGPARKKPS